MQPMNGEMVPKLRFIFMNIYTKKDVDSHIERNRLEWSPNGFLSRQRNPFSSMCQMPFYIFRGHSMRTHEGKKSYLIGHA